MTPETRAPGNQREGTTTLPRAAGSGVRVRPTFVLGTVRYDLVQHLGGGGMADVFLAAQRRGGAVDRFVALKVSRSGHATAVREGRLAARVSHPNVVRVLDVVPEALVLEWIEGASVRDLLERAGVGNVGVPAPIAARVALDVLDGLQAVHEAPREDGTLAGMIHRDVSAANVLVGADGLARVIDFGLAREWDELLRPSTHVEGTPRYLAPEQARGEVVDRRVDVFGAGIVLWEMLTGAALVEGQTVEEMMRFAATGGAEKKVVADPRACVDPALKAVVLGALATSPSRRFASAADFGAALRGTARAPDAVASCEEVGAWLEGLDGARIARQRARLAEWLAAA